MTTKTKKAHQHLEVIRRLEAQNYIFTQDPKIITEAVKLENGTAFDKLFIRAQKLTAMHALCRYYQTHSMVS